MSRYDTPATGRAVALRYDGGSSAPIVVASGMGYLPVYEDNSLATMLSQLQLGQAIPDSLYQAIVEIYVYFLNFDPNDPDKARKDREQSRRAAMAAEAAARAAEAKAAAARAAAADADEDDE